MRLFQMPSVYTLGLEPQQMDDFFRRAETMVDRRHDKNEAFVIRRFVAKHGGPYGGPYGNVRSFEELYAP